MAGLLAPEPVMTGTARAPRRLRVLHAEDDPLHARLIRRAISPLGDRFDLTHVEDGRSALELSVCLASSGTLDLVLLDLGLPRMSGFEVLCALRRDARTRRVPVVIVSTCDDRARIDRSYQLGANAYVCKVGHFDEMSRSLRGVAMFWLAARDLGPAGAGDGKSHGRWGW